MSSYQIQQFSIMLSRMRETSFIIFFGVLIIAFECYSVQCQSVGNDSLTDRKEKGILAPENILQSPVEKLS